MNLSLRRRDQDVPLAHHKMLGTSRFAATTPSGARLAGLALAVGALLAATASAAASPAYRIAIVSLVPAAADVSVHVEFGDLPTVPDTPLASVVPPRIARRPPEAPPLHGRIGDRRDFWVRWYDGTGLDRHDGYRRLDAVLTAASPHADVWIASDLATTLDPALLARLPEDAENAYAALHGHFGALTYAEREIAQHGMIAACEGPTPLARTPRPIPAFVPSRGELLSVLVVPTSAARYGYADIASYRYQVALRCSGEMKSNELPGLVVLAYDARAPGDALATTFVAEPAHELQHLENYVRHAIRAVPSTRQSPLVDEGLSMLAQDLAVRRMDGTRIDARGSGALADEFLAHPNAYSALTFAVQDGPVQRRFTGGSYGAAYLLQRFLYDRFGEAYLEAVTDTDALDLAALERATGLRAPELLRAFARSLLNVATTPLPGADFRIVGGSVSLFTSSRPIARVRASGGTVVWVEAAAASP